MPIAHAQLHELLISTIYQLVTEIGSKSVLQKEWVTGSISHYVFFVVCVQVFFILCSLTIWASNFSVYPKKLCKGMDKIIGFYPTNQNTLYLLCLLYSDNEIITVHGRPAICTLIGWFLVIFCGFFLKIEFPSLYTSK